MRSPVLTYCLSVCLLRYRTGSTRRCARSSTGARDGARRARDRRAARGHAYARSALIRHMYGRDYVRSLLAAEPSSAISDSPLTVSPTDETESDARESVLPPLGDIEQRGVSAEFLAHVGRTFLTEAMASEASVVAAADLKTKIAELEAEIQQKRAARATHMEPATNPQHNSPEQEPEDDGLDMIQDTTIVEHSEQTAVGMLERKHSLLREDLLRRVARPYLTVRDVHRLLVVEKTKGAMCRFVELPEVHGGSDLAAWPHIGTADYFFSYSWDSPWESIVSALELHTQRQAVVGGAPPYYWIDIFAVNQHLAVSPWRCESGLGGDCPGCAAVRADMHDWAVGDLGIAKGFERVIAHTKHTLVLNEPWDNPRPPTRVWCLFESYQTLSYGGKLEVVLDQTSRLDLQLQLSKRFDDLQSIVDGIDGRLAGATMAVDRDNIFGAIERLPGGFDGLNEHMQQAQQYWLCDAAEGVIERTNPWRPRLNEKEIALVVTPNVTRSSSCPLPLAWQTTLVEWFPRLPPLMTLLGPFLVFGATFIILDATDIGPGLKPTSVGNDTRWEECEYEDPNTNCYAWLMLGPTLFFGGGCVSLWGIDLTQQQIKRQLRRPPLFGECGTRLLVRLARSCGRVLEVVEEHLTEFWPQLLLVLIVLQAAVLWWTIRWQMGLAWLVGFPIFLINVGFALESVIEAADDRARLRTRVSWLQARMGDTQGAVVRLGHAQVELLRAVGPGDIVDNWVHFSSQEGFEQNGGEWIYHHEDRHDDNTVNDEQP
eukprot:COSAG02_NODE_1114_length_14502_cov_140.830035_10_plen_769_part_00